jgi:hypothetical protein
MQVVTREQMSLSWLELSFPNASVDESPWPSAYGVSPPTQMPTSPEYRPLVLVPTFCSVMVVPAVACCSACQNVVPVVVAPPPPCQLIDQPHIW